MLSNISDILGIASFLFSLSTFIVANTILKNVKYQRKEYETERFDLQTELMALRDNILIDKVEFNLKLRSKIRTSLYTYRQKYLSISSISCIYHLTRAISLCRKYTLSQKTKEKLCISLDFLIARFNKTEEQINE